MIFRIGLCVCAVFLLSSCRALGPAPALHTDSADEIQQILDSAAKGQNHESTESGEVLDESGANASTDGVSAADAITDPELTERRFDLRVENAPTRTFFHTLVADTQYNVVVHPDVRGSVSLDLTMVTVTEVMDIMRSVYGLDAVLQDSTFQIYPDALRTEIFEIDYLNIKRSGQSEMQVSAGKVTDSQNQSSGNNQQNNQNRNAGGQGGNSGQQGGNGSVVGTIVNTSGYSDFWVELEDTLTAIIAIDSGSHVVVTPQAGLAVVRAKPDSLAAVRSYLNQVQSSIHRQVILEAKILEVTLKEGFQAGINWNTFGSESGGSFSPVSRVGADGLVTTTLGSNNDVAGEFKFGAGNFFNPLGSQFSLFSEFADFSAVINLLETQGVVQVLSSPRIATVNNQKAVIKVGDDEFFVTDISTNTVTAGSAINTNDSPELTPFFSGIALDVTPQISSDGDVILHVHPTVSEVTEQIKIISGEAVPLAASTIRESDSVIRARNGDIVVIGGLMQNSSTDSTAGIPILGRLQGLGAAFRQRDRSSTKSELVILLRPIVIDDQSQKNFYKESARRVSRLRKEIGAPNTSNRSSDSAGAREAQDK